jgi:hypothetical protein
MIYHRATALILLLAVAAGPALGQSPDPAAERARLGNERIEAERQAREEIEKLNQAQEPAAQEPAAQAAAVATPATEPQSEAPPAGARRPPADADRTERGLQQLRELGKLKDAGYLSDAEFRRIKQQILESQF